MSVCVSAGDDGSNDWINDGRAHVNFPVSSPFVLACGGTKLTALQSKIFNEVVWNRAPGALRGRRNQ